MKKLRLRQKVVVLTIVSTPFILIGVLVYFSLSIGIAPIF